MMNKVLIFALILVTAISAHATNSNDKDELTSEEIKNRLERMREDASERYSEQEEYLEEYVSKLGDWVKRKRENYDDYSEQQQRIVKKRAEEYQILRKYLGNFKRLNRVRGKSEGTKYFSRLRELKQEYENLTGEKVPLQSKKEDDG